MIERIITKLYRRFQTSGLKLKELAHRTGLTSSFLSQMFKGRTQPSLETLETLALELGYKLDLVDEAEYQDKAKLSSKLKSSIGEVVDEILSI